MKSGRNTILPKKITPDKKKVVVKQSNLAGINKNQIYNQKNQTNKMERTNSNQRTPFIIKSVSPQFRENQQLNPNIIQDEEIYQTQKYYKNEHSQKNNQIQSDDYNNQKLFKDNRQNNFNKTNQLYNRSNKNDNISNNGNGNKNSNSKNSFHYYEELQQSQNMIQDSLNIQIQNQQRQKKRPSSKKISNPVNLQNNQVNQVNDASRIIDQQKVNFNIRSKKTFNKLYNQQQRQQYNRTDMANTMANFHNDNRDINRSYDKQKTSDRMNGNTKVNIQNKQNKFNVNTCQSNKLQSFKIKQGNNRQSSDRQGNNKQVSNMNLIRNNENLFLNQQDYENPQFTLNNNTNHLIHRNNRTNHTNNFSVMNQQDISTKANNRNCTVSHKKNPMIDKQYRRNNQHQNQTNLQQFEDNQKNGHKQFQASDGYNQYEDQYSNQKDLSFKQKQRFVQAGHNIFKQAPRHLSQKRVKNAQHYEYQQQYYRKYPQQQYIKRNQFPHHHQYYQTPNIHLPRFKQGQTCYHQDNYQFEQHRNSPYQQHPYSNPLYYRQSQFPNSSMHHSFYPPSLYPPPYNNFNPNNVHNNNPNINGLSLPPQEMRTYHKNDLKNRIIQRNNLEQQQKLTKDQQLAQLSQQNRLKNENKLKQQVEQLKKKLEQKQKQNAKFQQKQMHLIEDTNQASKNKYQGMNSQQIKDYPAKNIPSQQSNQLKAAQQSLLSILKLNQEQTKFNQLFNQIHDAMAIDDISFILLNHTGKINAGKLAKLFYKALGKDKTSMPKIQEFYHALRIKKIPGEEINQIKLFVSKGRKQKIKDFIIQKIGIYEGEKLFSKYQEQIPKIDVQPLIGSKQIKHLAGLDIYEYPTNHIYAYDIDLAKTLIVLGQTGCGKSTFLNALVNYLAGIQLQDPFRYFIIIENTQTQINSITSKISTYFIKDIRNGNCYRVIDTPGFGDTGGLEKDKQTVRQIQNLFKTKLSQIHLVLFLVKSSTTRVTKFHQYIFQSVMYLFDTTVAENFVFVCTFADASDPVVLESIKHKESGFGLYWDEIKQPKVIQVNNSGFFQKPKRSSKITAQFWKIGFQFMSKLIAKAEKIQAKSLRITKELIRKKQQLSINIKNTAEKIQYHVIQQQNIRAQIQLMIQNEDKMKRNEKFQFQVDQQEWYGENVQANVTRCNNCLNSNCHPNCAYGDGVQKKNCSSMNENGNCTVCPGKCHYVAHTNDHVLRKQRTVKKKMTNDQLKFKYQDAKGKISWYQNSINKMLQDLQNSINSTKNSIKEMTNLHKQLQQISMSKSKPQSTKDYIQFLIQGEQRQQKPGYLKKIQSYHLTLRQLEVEENILTGTTLKETINRKEQLLKTLMKGKAQESTIFNRFKKFLGF